MEFDNVLKERRSVRKYKASAVTGEQLEKLIQAAQYAPSWKNLQTSRYYVIDAPDVVAILRRNVCRNLMLLMSPMRLHL